MAAAARRRRRNSSTLNRNLSDLLPRDLATKDIDCHRLLLLRRIEEAGKT